MLRKLVAVSDEIATNAFNPLGRAASAILDEGDALAPDGEVHGVDIECREMRQGGEVEAAPRLLQDVVDRAESEAIMTVLREVDGNKEKAAEVLGLSSTTLWRKMRRLELSWP